MCLYWEDTSYLHLQHTLQFPANTRALVNTGLLLAQRPTLIQHVCWDV